MNTIELPVSVGIGTQPADEDDAQLEYMQLPAEMITYSMPFIPEPEMIADLDVARNLLHNLHLALAGYRPGATPAILDLAGVDDANRDLINQVLGEGEVSVVCNGRVRCRIQESVLAGVWRVQILDTLGGVRADHIEVAAIPSLVMNSAFSDAAGHIAIDAGQALPEGVLNAPPLLTELNDRVTEFQPGAEAHVINLTLLPQSEADLAFLDEQLGKGPVTILSRGYGNCRISSTGTRNIWWVQYFNSQEANILNTLEVIDMPLVACAAVEDIQDSAQRLHEILEVYQ